MFFDVEICKYIDAAEDMTYYFTGIKLNDENVKMWEFRNVKYDLSQHH